MGDTSLGEGRAVAQELEAVFYDDGDVTVTNRRVTVGEDVYPLRHVLTVRRYPCGETNLRFRPSPLGFAAVAFWAAVFLPCAVLSVTAKPDEQPPWVMGGVLSVLAGIATALALLFHWRRQKVLRVDLQGTGGVLLSLRFPDHEAGEDVYRAVCEALGDAR
jgi:hypothetical protein